MWRGSSAEKKNLVDASLAALGEQFPGAETDRNATLVGFSQGAFLALDLATHHQGPWSNLILIGASVEPDPRALANAGIRRVLLASGDYDGAKGAMRTAAARLSEAGIESTWKSLGPVGHQFAFDMDAWMAVALEWVRR
jgi:predicted esterase